MAFIFSGEESGTFFSLFISIRPTFAPHGAASLRQGHQFPLRSSGVCAADLDSPHPLQSGHGGESTAFKGN